MNLSSVDGGGRDVLHKTYVHVVSCCHLGRSRWPAARQDSSYQVLSSPFLPSLSHCSHTPYTHNSHTAPLLPSPPPQHPSSTPPSAPYKYNFPQNSSPSSAHTSNNTASHTPASSTSLSAMHPRTRSSVTSRITAWISLRGCNTDRRCSGIGRARSGRSATGFHAAFCRRARRARRRAFCWRIRGGCLLCRRSR